MALEYVRRGVRASGGGLTPRRRRAVRAEIRPDRGPERARAARSSMTVRRAVSARLSATQRRDARSASCRPAIRPQPRRTVFRDVASSPTPVSWSSATGSDAGSTAPPSVSALVPSCSSGGELRTLSRDRISAHGGATAWLTRQIAAAISETFCTRRRVPGIGLKP